jgi:hypothetical protein
MAARSRIFCVFSASFGDSKSLIVFYDQRHREASQGRASFELPRKSFTTTVSSQQIIEARRRRMVLAERRRK